jgi:hypothetical protein
LASDAKAGIEVTYTFSHEDYLHFIDFWVKRNRGRYIRRTAGLFILLFLGYFVLFLMSNLMTVHAVILGAVLATISASVLNWAQGRRMRRVRKPVLGERMTKVGPEGVFGRFPQFEILNYWKGISEITEDESYFFFFTSGSRAHVVPKRAFANAGDVEQFREAANSYLNSSRS